LRWFISTLRTTKTGPVQTVKTYSSWRLEDMLNATTRLTIAARELVETVKKNVTIDWTMRENVQAQLRVYVKRILRKYGYPPDMQEQATQTVLAQAKVLSEVWAIG